MGLLKIAFVSFVTVMSVRISYLLFKIWTGVNEKFFEWLDSKELV